MVINGINIYVLEKLVESDSLVILTHGIAEHIKRYEFFMDRLNAAGISCVGYDLPGHGQSEGKRGYIKSFKNYTNVLHELVVHYKKLYKKIFLFGHSMGGGIVNIYNAMYDDIDGIISSGASVDTPKDAKILKTIPFWLIGWLKQKTSFGMTLTSDEKIVNEYQNDPLVLKHFYGKLAGEMFIRGVKFIKKNVKNMNASILFVHGKEDVIVDYNYSIVLYNQIPIPDKKIIIYEKSRHEILNDIEKEKVLNDIIVWIKNHE